MTTIYRDNADRLSVADAKRLILGAAPLVSVGELHATMDEETGRLTGPIEHRAIGGVNAFERDIHDDFFSILQQLGIKPRHIYKPSDTNYRNTAGAQSCFDAPELPACPGVDNSYAINHDEFVRVADAFGAKVVLTKAHEPGAGRVTAVSGAPAPVAADMPSTAQDAPMKKAALIAALEHEWPSINADLSEATRNGLRDAAHAGKHGEWHEPKARAWAVSKGKIKQAAPALRMVSVWPGNVTLNRT